MCTLNSYQRWICLAVHPARVSINPALLCNDEQNGSTTEKDDRSYFSNSTGNSQKYLAMGFSTSSHESPFEHERAVITCRRLAARLLATLFVHYEEQQANDVLLYLTQSLNYRSAIHRTFVGMIAGQWAQLRDSAVSVSINTDFLQERLTSALNETIYFDEIAPSFTKLKRDFTSFMSDCAKQRLCNPQSIVSIE